MNMKLRGNKSGRQHLHVREEASPAGVILLLCLYLLGAAVGCYLAKGLDGPNCAQEDWVLFCACADGVLLALALLLPRLPLYPLLPLTMLPLKGLLTSAWVVWQCTDGTAGEYLRCCGRWGLFSAVSLLCLLVAFLQGLARRVRPGRRERRFRTAMILLGILYGILGAAVLLQCQLCKWL